jgi:hypothetical protein
VLVQVDVLLHIVLLGVHVLPPGEHELAEHQPSA